MSGGAHTQGEDAITNHPQAATRLFLTGPPGCGKTTAIRRTLERLARPAAGFFTQEVRVPHGGGRLGFDVESLDGHRGPLARIGGDGPRVGRYRVDVPSFDAIGVRALELALEQPGTVLVIDELGKMEFLSPRFLELLPRLLAAPNPLLGTILARPHPVADRVRRARGVEVIAVTAHNRDDLPLALAERLAR